MIRLISHEPVSQNDQVAEVTTYQGATSLRIHAMGFLEIATVAAGIVLEGKAAIDAITPSIMYSIRHAVELFLKHVIAEVKEVHGVTVMVPDKEGIMREEAGGHSLIKLWDLHRGLIVEALDFEANHDEHANFDRRVWLSDFEEIIKQLHTVDPDGQTLRYPANRKGAPNLGSTMLISVVQLERFARHVADRFLRFTERTS